MVLTAQPPRSVLLVGSSGVGKTAVVRELARRRADFELDGRNIRATSGSRLVAGMSCFGMWQERCQQLVEESSRSAAIVHLGSLFELMEVGKSESSGVGIAQFLRLPIVRGKLLAIAEATPEQFQLIERQHPELIQAFDVIHLQPPTPDHCREILSSVANAAPPLPQPAGESEAKTRPLITPEALAEIDHLHRRYATYSALPGRPLRFLSNLLQDRLQAAQNAALLVTQTGPAPAQPISPANVIAAFSRETGLPHWLLDDQALFDPEAARGQFLQRVKGQDAAIAEVVQWLGLIKAQLVRPQRPLASLLFVGPTGVGKTELAKALAEILFGDEQRMTRFDMSEFSDPWSVQRLIGGAEHEEGLLTAKVREQPFCVLLLDEFEKADHSVFDLLLQVLGDARLTDAGGRVADFSNTVMIFTSNLGATSFQRGKPGFVTSPSDQDDSFIEAVRQFLRPEMFNRIDRIVSFRPLDAETIREITALELERLKQRDGLRFRLTGWECTPAARDWLAEQGYDARFGARPLKRVIERKLLAPLSENLLRIPATQQVGVRIDVIEGSLSLTVTSERDVTKPAPPVASGALAFRVTELQRQTSLLSNCPCVRRLQNELARAGQFVEREHRRMLRRIAAGKSWSPPREHAARQKVVNELQSFFERLNTLQQAVADLEDRCWVGLLQRKSRTADAVPREELLALQSDWRAIAQDLLYRQYAEPHRAVLAVFASDRSTLGRLVAAYQEVCRQRQWTFFEWEYAATRPNPAFVAVKFENPADRPLFVRYADQPLTLTELPEHVIGIGLEITGTGAYVELSGESGTHRFQNESHAHDCAVLISHESMANFRLPPNIGRLRLKSTGANTDLRRTCDLVSCSLTDHVDGEARSAAFHPDRLGDAICSLIDQRIEREIQRLLMATS